MSLKPQVMLKYIGLGPILTVFCLLELILLRLHSFANDPGVGWHLKTGELILSSKLIPRTDPFLASISPRPWISDQWLADVLLAKLYLLGNWPAIYGMITAIFFLTFFFILYNTVRLNTTSPTSILVACLIAIKMASLHFILRPVVFGIFCFALCAFLLANEMHRASIKQSDLSRWPRVKFSILIFLLFSLWVNLHGSYTLGIILVWAHSAFFFISQRKRLSISFMPAAASLIGALCNPYGLEIFTSALALSQSSYFLSLNTEWLPINYQDFAGKIFIGTLLLIMLSSACTRKLPGSLIDISLLVFFALLSHRMVRILPYFAVLAAPLVAQSLVSFGNLNAWKKSKPFAQLLKALAGFDHREKHCLSAPTASLVLVTIIVLSCLQGSLPLFKGDFGPDKSLYPYKAVHSIALETHKTILTPPNWGGFVVFASNGMLMPIIDDRNQLIGEALYKELFEALKSPSSTIEFAKKHNAHYILLPTRWKLATQLATTRKPIFKSNVSTLFVL